MGVFCDKNGGNELQELLEFWELAKFVVAKSQIFIKELLEFRELAKCVGRCKISNIYQIITRISGALKVCRSLQNLKHLTNIFKSRKVLSVATK